MATTPYGGLYRDADTGAVYAPKTGPHILVSGPSGGGKTESTIVPALMCHTSGPKICISSKPDVVDLYSRCPTGQTYIIDLRQVSESRPAGKNQLRIDPTRLIGSVSDALNMASWMYKASTLALGGTVTSQEDPFWTSLVIPCLATILYAAAIGDKTMNWVMQCAAHPHIPDTAAATDHGGADTEPPDSATDRDSQKREKKRNRTKRIHDFHWGSVVEELAGSLDDVFVMNIVDQLIATSEQDPRQRDSVAMGVRGTLFPWLYPTVNAAHEAFTMKVLDSSYESPCLFILAEPSGGGVSAALPLVQHIINHYRMTASSAGAAALDAPENNALIAIDELTNTLPLPYLDILVSESRGLGVSLLCVVQDSTQLEQRYGHAMFAALKKLFPAILLMYGASELDILELASLWSGITTRFKESVDQKTGDRSYTPVEEPLFTAMELHVTKPYHGRLVIRGTPGYEVHFPPLDTFMAMLGNHSSPIPGLNR